MSVCVCVGVGVCTCCICVVCAPITSFKVNKTVFSTTLCRCYRKYPSRGAKCARHIILKTEFYATAAYLYVRYEILWL